MIAEDLIQAPNAGDPILSGIWTASTAVFTPGETLSSHMLGLLMIPQVVALLLLIVGIHHMVRRRKETTHRIFLAGIACAVCGFCAIYGTTRFMLEQPRTELHAYAYTGESFTTVSFDDEGMPSAREIIDAKVVVVNGVPLADGNLVVQAVFDDGRTQEMTLDAAAAVELADIVRGGNVSEVPDASI